MAFATDNKGISRRRTLASLACTAIAAPWNALAQSQGSVKICQTTALSGPLGDLGQAVHQGARACFDAVNAQGGVHGRKIQLETLDDGYDVKRALSHVNAFMNEKETFALFNCFGTPMIEAMLPGVIDNGIPFFAPFTGALSARPKARNVFNIRASYPEEAEHLVNHLAVGIKRIGLAYQNNSFGKEVYVGARAAMDRHKLNATETVTVETSAEDAQAAAAKMAQASPDAVIVALAGKAAIEFIKALRANKRGIQIPLYTLSVMGSAATLRALGGDSFGVAISQVVPTPQSVLPVVRDFHQAWKAAKIELEPSHMALEGYINARVFVEALKRAGRNLSRERFIETTWAMKRTDVGGFEIDFGEPGRNASRFVEMVVVGRDGRLIR